jgi:hypothetical protein
VSLGPPLTEIALIALDMPLKPTSADLLKALARAERCGYERAYRELAQGIMTADTAVREST